MPPSGAYSSLYVISKVVPEELLGGGHCVAAPWVSDLGCLKQKSIVNYMVSTGSDGRIWSTEAMFKGRGLEIKSNFI